MGNISIFHISYEIFNINSTEEQQTIIGICMFLSIKSPGGLASNKLERRYSTF